MSDKWRIELGGIGEFSIEQGNAESYIDDGLEKVEMGYAEYLILEPEKPINGCSFLQTCPDSRNEGFLHIEAAFPEKRLAADNSLPLILCMDGVTTGETLDVFMRFLTRGELDVTGWQELRWQ